MAHLGIDLGTSNTLAAIVTDGQPVLQRFGREQLVPSVIYLEEQGATPSVGLAAKDSWADPDANQDHVFRRWKMMIGTDTPLATLRPGGALGKALQVTPEYLTQIMVEYVVGSIGEGLGGEQIESVIITVPHGWRRGASEKCRKTREAARRAIVKGKKVNVQELTVSEPVAAAAYWIWATRKETERQAGAVIEDYGNLDGKVILICDVGGGTFDLSLVKVGGQARELDVIDAINNSFAGDYADALICGWVCSEFNAKFNTSYPTSADEILKNVETSMLSYPFLRGWMVKCEELKESISGYIANAVDSARIASAKSDFSDPEERTYRAKLAADTFYSILEPLYSRGSSMIRQFLESTKQTPDAVICCGGGSRIGGVQSKCMIPVLKQLFGQESAARMAGWTTINDNRADEAICLGAALIASKLISVKERLLYPVGIVVALGNPALARELKVPVGVEKVLLTPLLQKGTVLPASATSKDSNVVWTMPEGKELRLEVVIDDDIGRPFVQNWIIPHPAGGREIQMGLTIEADQDGALTLSLVPTTGKAHSIMGYIERNAVSKTDSDHKHAYIAIGTKPANNQYFRVSPSEVSEASKRLADNYKPKEPAI